MIIVKLWGGMGNQMFQYAAARRLAHVNGDILKLDTRWFGRQVAGDTLRSYELEPFSIAAEPASSAECRRLRGIDTRSWPKIVKRALSAVGYTTPASLVTEKHFHFDPEILQVKGDVYLEGYWQSERYFQEAEEVIRREFTIRTLPRPETAGLLERMRQTDSVSVHFRRGDYVTNANAATYHGTLAMEYYQKAIPEVCSRLRDPLLFVFSDDQEWVRANLRTTVPVVYVAEDGPRAAMEELRLMSACKHHIIANSSFSWWGAWLGSNPEKTVIAPERWFRSGEMSTRDLLPEGWSRL